MYEFSLLFCVMAIFFGFPELKSRAMLSSFKGLPLDYGFSSPVPLLVVVSLAPFGLYGPLPILLPPALFFIALGLLNLVDMVEFFAGLIAASKSNLISCWAEALFAPAFGPVGPTGLRFEAAYCCFNYTMLLVSIIFNFNQFYI